MHDSGKSADASTLVPSLETLDSVRQTRRHALVPARGSVPRSLERWYSTAAPNNAKNIRGILQVMSWRRYRRLLKQRGRRWRGEGTNCQADHAGGNGFAALHIAASFVLFPRHMRLGSASCCCIRCRSWVHSLPVPRYHRIVSCRSVWDGSVYKWRNPVHFGLDPLVPPRRWLLPACSSTCA